MKTRLIAVAALWFLPTLALAQWDDPPPTAYGHPGPSPDPVPGARAYQSSQPKMRGFELSFALGYAIPYGDYYQSDSGVGSPIGDEISGQIPVQIGAGYRINHLVSVGGFFEYGHGMVKDSVCPSSVSCSATDYRLGFEARFHFSADQSFSPWVSVGHAVEFLSREASGNGRSDGLLMSGFELVHLGVGGDIRASDSFSIGPFLGVGAAQFYTISDGSDSIDIPGDNQSIHGWIRLGVRGAFTL